MHIFRWRLRRPRQAGEFSLNQLAVERNSRFLVIAPHSDDEILGAGGLMYMAAKAGCAVHVVMLTNGDGYNKAALGGQSRRLRPTAARAIAFAYERQRETVEALQRLGLDDSDLTFLGYPDRGLAAMWERHWHGDVPYRSRFTGATRSPYHNSRTPNAPFIGTSLVADLESVILQFQPTHIVVPHPNDFHGDHWAGCCFTLYALESLRVNGRLRAEPVVLQYMVHQGPWPKPRGFRPGIGLHPPATYAGLRFPWVTLPLSRAAVAHKHDALLCYRSQMVFMRNYLLSFVRANELFGVLQYVTPPVVETGRIVIDGNTSEWTDVAGEVLYPMRDSLAKRVGRSADVKAVRVCRDADKLYLRMELRHRAVDDYVYGITLHGITPHTVTPHELTPNGIIDGPAHIASPARTGRFRRSPRFRQTNRTVPTASANSGRRRLHIGMRVPDRIQIKGEGGWESMRGIVGRAGNRELEVALPLADLIGPARLFLGVETRYRGIIIDRPALQLLDLS